MASNFLLVKTALSLLAGAALLGSVLAGLVTAQAWRWKDAHRVELVLFAHLSLAFAGWFLVLASGG